MNLKFSVLLSALFTLNRVCVGAIPTDRQGVLENLRPADSQGCGDPRLLVPLYRLWNPIVKDDFYTVSPEEKQHAISFYNYRDEGVAGYLWAKSGEDRTVPLFRLYNGKLGISNHFYTTSVTERDALIGNGGYGYEGIAGYVYDDGLCGGLPFHYVWSAHAQNSFYTMDAQERDDVINSRVDGYTSEGVRGFLVRF